jgi:5-(hydroxymethyl)furfural/furfural oxidase
VIAVASPAGHGALNGAQADWLIVGGGTAGCVLAARLSEDPSQRVVLLEAGRDFDQSRLNDLTDPSPARAFMDPRYFQPDLRARHGAHALTPEPYKQAMLIGGGSAINGQISLRGAPDDFDHWAAAGAVGWGWNDVLPYFRKLERDLDYGGASHGQEGPVAIKRIPGDRWDSLTRAISDIWTRDGHAWTDDMNGAFAAGHGPLPLANDGHLRSSTARAYLTAEVRRRPNLSILPETRALRIRFENGRASGVEARRGGDVITLDARRVILAAGALRSPQLLQLSGVGDGALLGRHGIATLSHRAGVGRNLQDHPNVVLSGFLAPGPHRREARRSVSTYLRYSSGLVDCPPVDMVMSVRARSAWHAIGARICGLLTYVALPASRGTVMIATPDPLGPPDVAFNGLADERDLRRLRDGVRLSARILIQDLGPGMISEVFPARLSRRIERLSRLNAFNDWASRLGALAMDLSPALRRLMIRHVVTDGADVRGILTDDAAAEDFVRSQLGTSWHACGTCRMGSATDPESVVDPDGAVIGVANLFVADASIMPRITRTNTNLPTIMIAEHLADRLRSRGAAA